MLFTFLLVVHGIIAALLVGVILVQKSEGGGLGTGGSPAGLMTARGAADFLTRATTVLATLFVLMSIGLAALATVTRGERAVDTSLAKPGVAAPAAAPAQAPPVADPLSTSAGKPAAGNDAVPLAQ
jgi:preprotein translocase subunit SecG